jgi:hypothetical protein
MIGRAAAAAAVSRCFLACNGSPCLRHCGHGASIGGGWRLVLRDEFARQGAPALLFRQCNGAAAGGLLGVVCPTYVPEVWVPRAVSDETIRAAAAFRSKGRLPVLTWWSSEHDAGLWRSSQPMVGITGRTSAADLELLQAVRRLSGRPRT